MSCPWNVTFILPSTIRAFGTAFKNRNCWFEILYGCINIIHECILIEQRNYLYRTKYFMLRILNYTTLFICKRVPCLATQTNPTFFASTRLSRITSQDVQHLCELFLGHLCGGSACSHEQFAHLSNLLTWEIFSPEQIAQVSNLLRNLGEKKMFFHRWELVVHFNVSLPVPVVQ